MTFDEGIYQLNCLGFDPANAKEWLQWMLDYGYTIEAAVGKAWAERTSSSRLWSTWTK